MAGEAKARFLMVQGTMSGVGKSLIVAGLCRVFAQDGVRVAPFKSQNMALNSFVTDEGLEMGRAQVMQAEAAGIAPRVCMNPILLKPTDDMQSQVIVNGRVVGNMSAKDYFEYKKSLIPDIQSAVDHLAKEYELIVIEGAGSPAEINLKQNDIVNMGMADMVDAPVLLVGDIDRGGVFAQLYGTAMLLDDDERARIRGLIINKFRGDKSLLDSGIDMIEKRMRIPIMGVLPYTNVRVDDEDSMDLHGRDRRVKDNGIATDIAIIKLPHISNFTDFGTLERLGGVRVRFVERITDFDSPDMVIIPGTKSTISDIRWVRENGFETVIKEFASSGKPVIGICGGYQMLGRSIDDPFNVETGGRENGLSLIPVDTVLKGDKVTRHAEGDFGRIGGSLSKLSGMHYRGYEIHMGESRPYEHCEEFTAKESGYCRDSIYGTYIHGLFDEDGITDVIIAAISGERNCDVGTSYKEYKETQYDILADMIRNNCDMDMIYNCVGI